MLEKVEEQAIYIIQLNQAIQEQQQIITSLQENNQAQEKQIQELLKRMQEWEASK